MTICGHFTIHGLEEQIKDKLDDPKLKFEDEYVEDVMGRVVDIRGVDSLPS